MTNKATTHKRARVGYNRTGRQTDADVCSLIAQKGLQDGGGVGSTRAFLRAARASPKTCTLESYGTTEREASGFGPTTFRPLHVRSLLPPFIGQEGSRSALTTYLPNLTT